MDVPSKQRASRLRLGRIPTTFVIFVRGCAVPKAIVPLSMPVNIDDQQKHGTTPAKAGAQSGTLSIDP